MVEINDSLEEGGFQKMTSKPVLVLSPGYTNPSDELKVVNAIIALLLKKSMIESYQPQTKGWTREVLDRFERICLQYCQIIPTR